MILVPAHVALTRRCDECGDSPAPALVYPARDVERVLCTTCAELRALGWLRDLADRMRSEDA